MIDFKNRSERNEHRRSHEDSPFVDYILLAFCF